VTPRPPRPLTAAGVRVHFPWWRTFCAPSGGEVGSTLDLVADERRVFLSTLPAGRRERQLALAVVVVSAGIFLTLAPFAKVKLAPVSAFIPIYESILVVTDLITAVLLLGQFTFLRARALLILASGYMFTGLITVSHALTFPGLFAPTGLLGAGPQSTAWLYMFWHGFFPLVVIAYAWTKHSRPEVRRPVASMLVGVGTVVVAVSALTMLATAGQGWLPPIMRGNQYTPVMILVVSSTWALSLIALAVLWRQRPHTVLDLWLMVVMCAWLFDIALAAVLNAGRFDLGFYAGRIYGLLAASFVLMVLLIENGRLYARLVGTNAELAGEVAERRRAEVAADAANQAKSEFLSRMSHELRTPLNAILGFGQLLEMDKNGSQDRESVQHILKAGRHLLALINEVLDIARIEAGRLSISLEPVIAGEVITATLDLMRPQASARGIRLPATAPNGNVYVMADRQRLQQVLLNLLSNAVKYNTDRGSVAVSCLPDPGASRVRIAIRDTGRGIPPEMLTRLFTPFDRLGADATSIEGTGLGLALSKRLVEAMGGTIMVESQIGEGTTFTIDVAAAEAPTAHETAASGDEATARPRATQGKILYVEDNVANIQLLQRIVARRPGVSLMAAMQGLAALDLARAHGPDLILMDLHLPDLPGDEVLIRLRRDPETREVPVVILSADATPTRIDQLLAHGARAYLTKPFDVVELLALIDTHLGS
jgi:signal transduction histidine kinase/CheY-like chemotaxis protein